MSSSWVTEASVKNFLYEINAGDEAHSLGPCKVCEDIPRWTQWFALLILLSVKESPNVSVQVDLQHGCTLWESAICCSWGHKIIMLPTSDNP